MAVLLAGGSIGDGPSWYRVELPCRWLKAHGVDARTVYNTVTQKDLEGVTVFSTQRGWAPDLLLGVLSLQQQRVRCIYEIDDDIWAVPDWNPLREWFTAEHVRGMEAIMRACDAATVTTERLSTMVARQTLKQVRLVPNAVPLDLFPAAQERTKPGVRVGWFGSDTHSKDLSHALPAMQRVLRERPEVTLVFMGAMPEGLAPGPRVEFHGWAEAGKYYAALRALELDVLVAPLDDHRFNYAKSNVKALEGGALGLAIIASDVGPYRCLRNGETGLKVKANRPDLWGSLLMDAVSDERLRAKLGAGARAWVEKEGSMDVIGPLWAQALGVEFGTPGAKNENVPKAPEAATNG